MTNMKHKIEKSSTIDHIDWHEPDTLEIKFLSGATYHYPNCDKVHYHGLKNAASAGSYFSQNVRAYRAIKQ